MSENQNIKIFASEGYAGPGRIGESRIIVPDRLPVRIIFRGIKVLINVGEFAILPAGSVYTVESSSKRYEISFDFRLIEDDPEFCLLLPVFILPYVYRHVSPAEEVKSVAFGRILPIRDPVSEAVRENEPVSPLELIKALCNESGGSFPQTAARAMLSSAYCLIGEEIFAAMQKKEGEKGRGGETRVKFAAAIDFINHNFLQDISLARIAEAAGYSETHLSHAFKEYYGISVYDYLTMRRVSRAAELLREGNMQIQDVVRNSGFLSSSTFNRVFRNELGVAPREYIRLPEI